MSDTTSTAPKARRSIPYTVVETKEDGTKAVRLVSAKSANGAKLHCANPKRFDAEAASASDVARMMSEGVKLETAEE